MMQNSILFSHHFTPFEESGVQETNISKKEEIYMCDPGNSEVKESRTRFI